MVTPATIKKGYKQTELGVIPEDWDVKRLGSIANIIMGQSPRSEFYNIKGIGLPLIQGNADIEKRKTIERVYTSLITKKGVKGNIIMSVRAPVGEISKATFNCCLGRGVCAIDYKNNYLYHYLVSFEKSWIKFSKGSTFDSINSKEVNELEIVLPKKDSEQSAIATILSDTDALIERLEELIAKKIAIKQGAMQQLLTGKKRLPGFSGEWEVRNLGEIATVIGGGTPSTYTPNYWNGHINWFTPTEIGLNKYTFGSLRKITEEGLKKCSARILPKGTVLLTTRAGIGDVSILMDEGCTNQGFQSLVANDDISYEFLYYLVSTLKNVLIQNASGSTFLEISPNKIKQIDAKIPNLKEQQAIAQILSDMDTEIEALEQKQAKYKAIKQGMMQELLTGKTRLAKEDKT